MRFICCRHRSSVFSSSSRSSSNKDKEKEINITDNAVDKSVLNSANPNESLKNNSESKTQLIASTPSVASVKEKKNSANDLSIDLNTIQYCTLPSSMLDLFSNQFGMLETAVNELKSLLVAKLDAVSTLSYPSSTTEELIRELTA